MKRTFLEMAAWTILIGLMLLIATAHAGQLRVGVIDTGLDLSDPRLAYHLCNNGGKDFTEKGIKDNQGHGTHIVGLIEQYAKDSDYCLVILKYAEDLSGGMDNYIKALQEAVAQKLDIVNISLSGEVFSEQEMNLICGSPDMVFVVAAGNEGVNLLKQPIYPAALDCSNIYTVGGLNYDKSNKGPTVKYYEEAINIWSTLPNNSMGFMTGTSQATAIRTGKLIYEKTHKKCADSGNN